MNYVEQTAYSILTANDVRALPVDTIKLARRLGYTVSPYSAARETLRSLGLAGYTSEYRAFTIVIDKQASIFYSDDLTPTKRSHLIAHEIGHLQFDFDRSMASPAPVLIGHAGDEKDEEQQERRADEFERYLIAPLPALDQCRVGSAAEIEALTGYGPAAAKEIYAELLAYQSRKAETEELLQTQKQFRRFGRTRWFSSHRYSVAIFFLAAVIISLCALLLAGEVTPSVSHPLPTSSAASRSAASRSAASRSAASRSAASRSAASRSAASRSAASRSAASRSEPTESEYHTDTVFITPSGKKYHRSGCRYIEDKYGLTELSPSEAERKGYDPCKVCGE